MNDKVQKGSDALTKGDTSEGTTRREEGFSDDGFIYSFVKFLGLVDYIFENVAAVVKAFASKTSHRTNKLAVKVNMIQRDVPIAFRTTVDVEKLKENSSADTWLTLDKIHDGEVFSDDGSRSKADDKDDDVKSHLSKDTFSTRFRAIRPRVISNLFSSRKNRAKRGTPANLDNKYKAAKGKRLSIGSIPDVETEARQANLAGVKSKFTRAMKAQKRRHEKQFKSAVKFIKDNYMEPIDQVDDTEDYDFAKLEIIVEESPIGSDESVLESDSTHSRVLKKGKNFFRHKKKETHDFFEGNKDDDETFEFNQLDVIKSFQEDKLLQQNVGVRQLTPREAELALISGGVKFHRRNRRNRRHNKKKSITLRRKVKLKATEIEATKNIGPAVRPKYIFIYLMIPLLILSVNHLIPFIAKSFNIFASPEKFEEYFQPDNPYKLPAIVQVLIPVEYHDILNEQLRAGRYLIRVGGLYAAYNLFMKSYSIFTLFRPRPQYVEKTEFDDIDERRPAFKFQMKF